jgi:hypothetical protein
VPSENVQPVGRGSGIEVDDFSSFCEGDTEPTLNKKIHTLIDSSRSYLVYLDEDFYVEWTFNGGTPKGFEDVVNRIGQLETLSITQLLDKSQREPFERLLGESLARILGDHNEAKAKAVLDEAEVYLKARGAENARRWFLGGVATIALPALLAEALLLWISSRVYAGPFRELVEVLSGTAIGGIGAFISVASRTEAIAFDPVAGRSIHQYEGQVRVLVGMAWALLVALAIKADLLLGVFRSLNHPFLVLLVACLTAGTSERFTSGLINSVGESIHGAAEKGKKKIANN